MPTGQMTLWISRQILTAELSRKQSQEPELGSNTGGQSVTEKQEHGQDQARVMHRKAGNSKSVKTSRGQSQERSQNSSMGSQ